MLNLNKKSAIVIFLILSLNGYFFFNFEKNSKIEQHLESKTKQIMQSYNVVYNDYVNISNIIFNTKIDTPEVKDIFKYAKDASGSKKDKIRKELYETLKQTYSLLKQYNLKQLHFHLPNNESFLRFHRPEKFGDDLSEARPTVRYVNEYKKAVSGFEEGRIYNGYRFVFPLFEDEEYLGSVEISFSTFAMNIELMKSFDVVGKFLISKKVVEEKVFKNEKSNYVQSQFEDFYYEKKIDETLQLFNKKNIKLSVSKKTKEILKHRAYDFESFSLYDEKSDSVMTFIKIQNPISNEVTGILTLRSESSYIVNKINNFYFTLTGFILFVLFAVIFVYRLMNEKNILNKLVEEKTRTLYQINKELEESEHELQLLNENLELTVKQEVAKNKEKDRILYEQTKMAALGEMIGNIAHQWRQPLSLISSIASSIQLNGSVGIPVDEKELNGKMGEIIAKTNYLSNTIDDFRNFIRGESTKKIFDLKQSVDSMKNLIQSSLKNNNINFVVNIPENMKIYGLQNELNQCLLNLFNNSKDALEGKDNKYIHISAQSDGKELTIKFKDNGGGIPENIINKIFEPYFTTKHQSQGTGLGLNMTYRLIQEGMGGTVSVENTKYIIDGIEYDGALFTLTLPF